MTPIRYELIFISSYAFLLKLSNRSFKEDAELLIGPQPLYGQVQDLTLDLIEDIYARSQPWTFLEVDLAESPNIETNMRLILL